MDKIPTRVKKRILNFFKRKLEIEDFPFETLEEPKKSELLKRMELTENEYPIIHFFLKERGDLVMTNHSFIILSQEKLTIIDIESIDKLIFDEDNIKLKIEESKMLKIIYNENKHQLIIMNNSHQLLSVINAYRGIIRPIKWGKTLKN